MERLNGKQAMKVLKGGGQVKWLSPDGMITLNMSSLNYLQFDLDGFKHPVYAISSLLDDLMSGKKLFTPIEP